ncbi:hypothetical protein EDD21DRAFT_2870 [Dissophora ornata]|nr:hypothetical protein EDD21DRAFT_2870 [Dissophora ornata]
MPHLVESRPSPTGPAIAGIGIHSSTSTMVKHSSSPLAKEANSTTALVPEDSGHSDSPYDSDSASEYSETESSLTTTTADERQNLKKKMFRRDLFSQLPANVLQQILGRLPPFQMLTISELSRKFYNFVVLGQEMNEVWFRLVKHEEAEEKKRVDWYKQKRLEQEQRSVQMMRSFSGSSTCSNMSSGSYADEAATPLSKQAQRLLNKKQEATGKSTSAVKVMKRSDRKKNWCKIYVDTILRGNGEDLLEPLSQLVPG